MKIVERLERLYPGVPLRTPCPLGARHAVNAAGEPVSVTECTVPLQPAFITTWGPATLPPISFASMEGSDGVILLEWPTPARQQGDPMKTSMSPPGPSVGTSVLGCRRVSLSADVSQETPGECYSRDTNEQGEVGACRAHVESIGRQSYGWRSYG